MRKLSNYLYNKVTLLSASLLTVLTFSYLFFVMTNIAKGFEVVGETQSLAMSFGFSIEVVQEYFAVRTKEMLSTFIEFNRIWDNIFALLYGLMYIFWLSFLFKSYSVKAKWLNLFPLLQTIFDWLENFQLAKLATYYLEYPELFNKDYLPSSWSGSSEWDVAAIVPLISIFTMIKWTVSILIFVLIIVGLILKVRAYQSNFTR